MDTLHSPSEIFTQFCKIAQNCLISTNHFTATVDNYCLQKLHSDHPKNMSSFRWTSYLPAFRTAEHAPICPHRSFQPPLPTAFCSLLSTARP